MSASNQIAATETAPATPEANITIRRDRTIEADNKGMEWLTLDDRVYWDNRGFFVLKSGESPDDIYNDATSDGLIPNGGFSGMVVEIER